MRRRRGRLLAIAIVLLACLFSPPPSGATIYSFVDENGVLHLTNVPTDPRYKPVAGTNRPRLRTSPSRESYDSLINRSASRYAVDPLLVKAVIKAESNFNRHAVSSKGAMGLMQLMPGTAQDLRVSDPFDPEENIGGGTRYLRMMLDQFNGDLKLALAAYNSGPDRVLKSGGIPPIEETERYIEAVLENYYRYQRKSGTIAAR